MVCSYYGPFLVARFNFDLVLRIWLASGVNIEPHSMIVNFFERQLQKSAPVGVGCQVVRPVLLPLEAAEAYSDGETKSNVCNEWFTKEKVKRSCGSTTPHLKDLSAYGDKPRTHCTERDS